MVRFKQKSRIWGPFQNWWTTIGSTIYYPPDSGYPDRIFHDDVLATLSHELVHVRQWKKYGWLLLLLYFLFPLPIGFAYFRWKFEREAYLTEIKHGWSIDLCVDVIWDDYWWPWPKSWMRNWFRRNS